MTSAISRLSLSLVGPGRAGRALARSWVGAGGRIEELISRAQSDAERAVHELGAGTPRTLFSAFSPCDVLILAVPDDAIAETSAVLAGRIAASVAFHLSGALAASRLKALRPGGTALGSLHPLRVFSGGGREDWRGALVAIEGEPSAVTLAEGLVSAMGARSHRIAAESKPLYHAAATLAAGGTVSLLSLASRACEKAGIPEETSRPALAGLAIEAARAVSDQAFAEALTGPVARRDLETVRAHLEALGNLPVAELYRVLARETLSSTPGRGREEEVRALLDRKTDNR